MAFQTVRHETGRPYRHRRDDQVQAVRDAHPHEHVLHGTRVPPEEDSRCRYCGGDEQHGSYRSEQEALERTVAEDEADGGAAEVPAVHHVGAHSGHGYRGPSLSCLATATTPVRS